MLKVLIADDEHIIKNGILQSIDWAKLGMQVIAAVDDGREAYQLAIEKKPDIIITDIRMPFMDGLEFIENLKKTHKDAYIIFISGHDEFVYAKTAIRLGAYDFIVKPIDLDYLVGILKRIADENHMRKNEVKSLELKRDKEQIAQNILARILFSSCEKNDIHKRLTNLGIEGDSQCVCIIFQIDNFDREHNQLETVQKYIDEVIFCAKQSSIFNHSILLPDAKNGRVIMAAFMKASEDLEKHTEDFVAVIRNQIDIDDSDTFSICIGNIHDNIRDLVASYNEAVETNNYSYVYGGNKDVFYLQYKSLIKDKNSDLNDIIFTFLSSIRSLDKTIIKKDFDIIKEMIVQSGANSVFYVKVIINSAYSIINETLHNLHVSINDIFEDPIASYKKISESYSIDNEFDRLFEFVSVICDYMSNKKDGSYNIFIEKAKVFIDNNFANASLSLEDVAKHIKISPSYISTLFKQYVGKPFVSYLTLVRIEKAKELLMHSQLKTYKICLSVGYDNPTYFSTVFKKHTGQTPSEFRNEYKNQT